MKKIKHLLESLVVKLFLLIFKVLPAKTASYLGGLVARLFGPLLSVNKTAKRNINRAFPEFKRDRVNAITSGMWDNLGRVLGEFGHLNGYIDDNFEDVVEIEGLEHFRRAQEFGRPVIFFSGHIANWEIVPKALGRSCSEKISAVYRKANNPLTDSVIQNVRNEYINAIPKGSVGARQLINLVKAKKPIVMLIDQKQNDGIAVPFFGKDAMTAPAMANIALKYNCAVLPAMAQRIDGKMKFRITILPEVEYQSANNKAADALGFMTKINQQIENMIKKAPEQWFWVHNRWPKSK